MKGSGPLDGESPQPLPIFALFNHSLDEIVYLPEKSSYQTDNPNSSFVFSSHSIINAPPPFTQVSCWIKFPDVDAPKYVIIRKGRICVYSCSTIEQAARDTTEDNYQNYNSTLTAAMRTAEESIRLSFTSSSCVDRQQLTDLPKWMMICETLISPTDKIIIAPLPLTTSRSVSSEKSASSPAEADSTPMDALSLSHLATMAQEETVVSSSSIGLATNFPTPNGSNILPSTVPLTATASGSLVPTLLLVATQRSFNSSSSPSPSVTVETRVQVYDLRSIECPPSCLDSTPSSPKYLLQRVAERISTRSAPTPSASHRSSHSGSIVFSLTVPPFYNLPTNQLSPTSPINLSPHPSNSSSSSMSTFMVFSSDDSAFVASFLHFDYIVTTNSDPNLLKTNQRDIPTQHHPIQTHQPSIQPRPSYMITLSPPFLQDLPSSPSLTLLSPLVSLSPTPLIIPHSPPMLISHFAFLAKDLPKLSALPPFSSSSSSCSSSSTSSSSPSLSPTSIDSTTQLVIVSRTLSNSTLSSSFSSSSLSSSNSPRNAKLTPFPLHSLLPSITLSHLTRLSLLPSFTTNVLSDSSSSTSSSLSPSNNLTPDTWVSLTILLHPSMPASHPSSHPSSHPTSPQTTNASNVQCFAIRLPLDRAPQFTTSCLRDSTLTHPARDSDRLTLSFEPVSKAQGKGNGDRPRGQLPTLVSRLKQGVRGVPLHSSNADMSSSSEHGIPSKTGVDNPSLSPAKIVWSSSLPPSQTQLSSSISVLLSTSGQPVCFNIRHDPHTVSEDLSTDPRVTPLPLHPTSAGSTNQSSYPMSIESVNHSISLTNDKDRRSTTCLCVQLTTGEGAIAVMEKGMPVHPLSSHPLPLPPRSVDPHVSWDILVSLKSCPLPGPTLHSTVTLCVACYIDGSVLMPLMPSGVLDEGNPEYQQLIDPTQPTLALHSHITKTSVPMSDLVQDGTDRDHGHTLSGVTSVTTVVQVTPIGIRLTRIDDVAPHTNPSLPSLNLPVTELIPHLQSNTLSTPPSVPRFTCAEVFDVPHTTGLATSASCSPVQSPLIACALTSSPDVLRIVSLVPWLRCIGNNSISPCATTLPSHPPLDIHVPFHICLDAVIVALHVSTTYLPSLAHQTLSTDAPSIFKSPASNGTCLATIFVATASGALHVYGLTEDVKPILLAKTPSFINQEMMPEAVRDSKSLESAQPEASILSLIESIAILPVLLHDEEVSNHDSKKDNNVNESRLETSHAKIIVGTRCGAVIEAVLEQVTSTISSADTTKEVMVRGNLSAEPTQTMDDEVTQQNTEEKKRSESWAVNETPYRLVTVATHLLDDKPIKVSTVLSWSPPNAFGNDAREDDGKQEEKWVDREVINGRRPRSPKEEELALRSDKLRGKRRRTEDGMTASSTKNKGEKCEVSDKAGSVVSRSESDLLSSPSRGKATCPSNRPARLLGGVVAVGRRTWLIAGGGIVQSQGSGQNGNTPSITKSTKGPTHRDTMTLTTPETHALVYLPSRIDLLNTNYLGSMLEGKGRTIDVTVPFDTNYNVLRETAPLPLPSPPAVSSSSHPSLLVGGLGVLCQATLPLPPLPTVSRVYVPPPHLSSLPSLSDTTHNTSHSSLNVESPIHERSLPELAQSLPTPFTSKLFLLGSSFLLNSALFPGTCLCMPSTPPLTQLALRHLILLSIPSSPSFSSLPLPPMPLYAFVMFCRFPLHSSRIMPDS